MFELRNPRQRAAELEAAIQLHLRHHTHATVDQLMGELSSEHGLTRSTVRNLLEDLEREGFVRRMMLNNGEAYCLRERSFLSEFQHRFAPFGGIG